MNSLFYDNEIFYKTQNHRYSIYLMIILFLVSLISAILMTIFWFHLEYKFGFFAFAFMFIAGARRNFPYFIDYFTNKLFITSNGILIKKNKDYKKIPFEEIQFIKQENRGEETNFKTCIIINMKNEEEVFCNNILDFKKFIDEIKKIYPSFDCDDCFKEDLDKEIQAIKSSLGMLATILLCFAIRQFGINFFMNKVFWMICIPIVIIIVGSLLPTLKKIKDKKRELNENQE